MWCTTFAFRRWHSAAEFKRYLNRFTHMISGFNTLKGIIAHNQYDSMVRPLEKWLRDRGVNFQMNARALSISSSTMASMDIGCDEFTARNLPRRHKKVREEDKVIVTLGSMVEGSSLGSMDSAPEIRGEYGRGGWGLWEKIAVGNYQFGCPDTFTEHMEQSRWVSFTTTLHDPAFFRLVTDRTGNVPGEGGLITFPESRWLASIVLPHQPHFIRCPRTFKSSGAMAFLSTWKGIS